MILKNLLDKEKKYLKNNIFINIQPYLDLIENNNSKIDYLNKQLSLIDTNIIQHTKVNEEVDNNNNRLIKLKSDFLSFKEKINLSKEKYKLIYG